MSKAFYYYEHIKLGKHNIYEHRDLYIIRTAEGMLDGVKNFTALFSRKDNPRLEELLAEFEETISIVFD